MLRFCAYAHPIKTDQNKKVFKQNMPNIKKKLLPRQRVDHIYRAIRERICLMHYPPGSLLREAELAKEFGVSRTPIRQAIKQLEFESLVISKNGVGTLVTDIEFERLADVYEMRLKAAELIGVMGPVQCTSQHLEQLQNLQYEASKLSDINDPDGLALINHELHNLTISLIGNKALRSIYDLYYFQTTRVWFQLMPQLWLQEVEALRNEINELISAIKRKDVVAFGFIKRNFIARVLYLLEQQLQFEKEK